jgi:hypothetical protein
VTFIAHIPPDLNVISTIPSLLFGFRNCSTVSKNSRVTGIAFLLVSTRKYGPFSAIVPVTSWAARPLPTAHPSLEALAEEAPPSVASQSHLH